MVGGRFEDREHEADPVSHGGMGIGERETGVDQARVPGTPQCEPPQRAIAIADELGRAEPHRVFEAGRFLSGRLLADQGEGQQARGLAERRFARVRGVLRNQRATVESARSTFAGEISPSTTIATP